MALTVRRIWGDRTELGADRMCGERVWGEHVLGRNIWHPGIIFEELPPADLKSRPWENSGPQRQGKAKEKYRGVFEIQKSGDKTSSREIGLDIRTHASPKVGQDQVSGGVSVPCRHAKGVFYKKTTLLEYRQWIQRYLQTYCPTIVIDFIESNRFFQKVRGKHEFLLSLFILFTCALCVCCKLIYAVF